MQGNVPAELFFLLPPRGILRNGPLTEAAYGGCARRRLGKVSIRSGVKVTILVKYFIAVAGIEDDQFAINAPRN